MSNAQPDFKELFANSRVFAIVGYSDKPERAGHFVPAYLAKHGYTIIAVNPKFAAEIDGFPNYHSLAEIPAEIAVDVIDIFRAPPYLPAVLEDALKMASKPRYFWMQPGAEDAATAADAAAAGMIPIMQACALAELKQLQAQGAL